MRDPSSEKGSKKMPLRVCLFALFLAAGTVFSFAKEKITLVENGKSNYVILLPAEPTPVQESAAKELASTLEEISGVSIPTERETAESAAAVNAFDRYLVIGPSATSKRLLQATIDESSIGYDGIVVKQMGRCIVFTGHPRRGPLYAVDTFLEEELGCRWWTESESTIPKQTTVTADDFDVNYTPDLVYRESFYRVLMGNENASIAMHLKCNGNSELIPNELGGHHEYLYFVHSFDALIPPTEYETHPDWFPEIDGVRKVGFPDWCRPSQAYKEMVARLKPEQVYPAGTQLCLTNEELFQTMLQRVLDGLTKNPNATIVSISQNDWHGCCTCEKCRKIAEEEESESGPLLRFVNRMAEEIEKVRPDVLVDTLAYQYTRKPPKITKARHNVIVRLCSIECSFTQTLDGRYGEHLCPSGEGRRPITSDHNAAFRADIEGWAEHAEHLFVWDYMTDFTLYLLPFPNYRVWADNIRFYIDHHTLGLFEQGDYHGLSGDFVQLRAWVVAKLLWNPNLSQRELMEEFIAGYYAPELVPVYMEYFDLLADAFEKTGEPLSIFRPSAKDWIDAPTLTAAEQLLNRAEQIAGDLEKQNPEKFANLLYKVRRERIPLDLVRLMDDGAFREEAKVAGIELPGPKPEEMKALAEDFCARLDRAGITRQAEWADPDAFQKFKDELIQKNTHSTDGKPE